MRSASGSIIGQRCAKSAARRGTARGLLARPAADGYSRGVAGVVLGYPIEPEPWGSAFGMIVFKDLWYGHPINESVQTPCLAPRDLVNLEGRQIKTAFPVFSNQCAIRMGVALRRAGVQPAQIGGCSHCSVHPREDMHFINASQLANAIARANIAGVGSTEKFTGADAAQFYPKIFGRTGIIFIQDYWHRSTDQGRATGDHIDVWNGYRSSAKWLMEWFSWIGYYSNYAGAGEIWFWEVK